MVYDKVYVPLCQEFETGSLWKNHTEQDVGIFNTAFLPAAHGITIVNMRTFFPIYSGFQRFRAAELRAPVCQNCMEQEMEIGIQAVFEPVKNGTDRGGCAAVHQIGKEQFFLPQIERKEYSF